MVPLAPFSHIFMATQSTVLHSHLRQGRLATLQTRLVHSTFVRTLPLLFLEYCRSHEPEAPGSRMCVGLYRLATLRAIAPTTLWEIQLQDLEFLYQIHPDLYPKLLRSLRIHLDFNVRCSPGGYW